MSLCTVLLRSVLAWLLILVFAMLNGALREAVLLPRLGGPAAPLLSGALLSTCIVIVAVVLARWLALTRASRGCVGAVPATSFASSVKPDRL